MLFSEDPVSVWILARLYEEKLPIDRKDLLRNLCQASFDSMVKDNTFADTMNALQQERYIEFARESYEDFTPIEVELGPPEETEETSTEFRKLQKTREGYVITEKGIIFFRREIITTIQKLVPNLDKLGTIDGKFARLIRLFRNEPAINLARNVVRACIDNAPLVIEFIQSATKLLGS